MVQYHGTELNGAFAALADPTRRGILERLGAGSATISELAEPFGISLTALKKHVSVLERARLLSTEKVGRSRRCMLGPATLEDLQVWIDSYKRALDARLDRLDTLLQETEGESDES
jgi:DNA-binding transcriptional ArsR family regulator